MHSWAARLTTVKSVQYSLQITKYPVSVGSNYVSNVLTFTYLIINSTIKEVGRQRIKEHSRPSGTPDEKGWEPLLSFDLVSIWHLPTFLSVAL